MTGATSDFADSSLARAALQTLTQDLSALTERVVSASENLANIAPRSGVFADVAAKYIPRWHFAMLNDAERNEALGTALARRIPAGAHVLDIGSGTGLLAMAAVRAGAGHVTTCEMNPLLAEIARQIIAAHGMSDLITVLAKPSTALEVGRDMAGPADVLVSEIVDCGLIGEGILPSIRHAREQLLARDGMMIPSSARLYGSLVQSEAVAALNRVHKAGGLDVSLLNSVATQGHFPVRLNTWPHQMLSDSAELLGFDLARDALEPGERTLTLSPDTEGVAHGLVVWFELDLGAGLVLRNAPENSGSHWMQGLVPLVSPVAVRPGEPFTFRLRWTENRLTVRTSHE